MRVEEAVDCLDLERWRQTSARERLKILKKIQANIITHADRLRVTNAKKLNLYLQVDRYKHEVAAHDHITIAPVANNVATCIRLYEYYIKNKHWLQAKKVTQVEGTDYYDVEVFPHFFLD